MTTVEFVTVAVAVFVAGFVQVLSGFGFALLAVPLMTLQVPTKEAVVISTLMGGGVTLYQAWHGRHHVDRPIARHLVIGAYLGMPFGLWVFLAVDEHVLRGILGAAVLVAVVLLAVRVNLSRVGTGLEVGAGFVSGVLNTSLSTNGPPLVFVLQARHLQPDAFRGTINVVFACCNVLGITLFLGAGKVTGDSALAALFALPALVAGQLCGFPLRRHVAGDRFRTLVLGLLVVAAATSIVNAFRA
ncbi:MAG: sulfite exporter TauE/SafE family protein [Actinobacteria bacterium]|nr:sulfite exporter TauE/SafE family protein [Actinomycetota bacterium]